LIAPEGNPLNIARGLVVAAPRSGSGKTLLCLGLMRALRNAGLRVTGAKCGPDYIDPGFHLAATGRPSFNLDSWAMQPSLLASLALSSAADCDLVLCEGLMGLFDGVPGEPGRTGSSADIASLFGWPVILVLDVSGQSQTAAAIVKGCATLEPKIRLSGVILNKVASDRHRFLVTRAVEAAGFAVLGSLPRAEKLHLPERHLGLVQAAEIPSLDETLEQLAAFVSAHVDLGAVVESARAARTIAFGSPAALATPAQKIAVARDEAFSFLYPHVVAGWRQAGAEIEFFSPLANEAPPPNCGFCWLPGGYPELHAGRIAAASHFLFGLRTFAERYPIHGECGGYMVLGETLTDRDGLTHKMAGLLGPSFSFAKRQLRLGYRNARLAATGPLGPAGMRLRGHEFHYATFDEGTDPDPAFALVQDAYSETEEPVGSRRGLVSGSFFHAIAADPGP
jgi:cobyrinic acid a,c-diamide synthase